MNLKLQIQLDFRSGQPIYLQIADQIRRLVGSGALCPGDQLPTVRQMAADLRVNLNTVARAYRLLDHTGLISTQHGRGTYIWETPDEETALLLRQEGLESLVRRYIQETQRLGYSLDELKTVLENQLLTLQNGERLPAEE